MAADDRPSITRLQDCREALGSGPLDEISWQLCELHEATRVLLEIAAAALAEAAAECTRQEPHWDYVEGGDEDVSCFKDIHCKVCPVAIAHEKFKAALAKVRE